jgi:hypothetical protein
VPAVWGQGEAPDKFYGGGGIDLYPAKRLYEEMGFIAYYFHWAEEQVMKMPHLTRVRWTREIARINREANELSPNVFEV